jgi:hypothetical protein
MKYCRLSSPTWLVWCVLFCIVSHECADAQKKRIPKRLPVAVITAFQKTYPKAKIYGVDVEQRDTIVYYKIECRDGAVHRNILYTADGSIFEKEESVAPASLPERVKAALDNRFKRYKVQSARRTVRDTAIIGYAVKLTSGKKDYAVTVDSSNTLVRVKEVRRSDY